MSAKRKAAEVASAGFIEAANNNKKKKSKKANQNLAFFESNNTNLGRILQTFGNNGIGFAPKGKTQIAPTIQGRVVASNVPKELYRKFVLRNPGALPFKNWEKQYEGAKLKYRANLSAGAAKITGNRWNTAKVMTALAADQDWKKYFNKNSSLRDALNKTLTRNTSLVPQGIFRKPTQNPNINLQTARAIVAAARVNREASHYTGSYLQSHLGDYLETVGFTIGAAASPGAFPVYWKSPSNTQKYGLNGSRGWEKISQYFDPSYPYDTTVILESEVPFENTIKQFPVNTTNSNKKIFVEIIKRESNPASRRPGAPMTTWNALPATPYKGWGFGKPDAVIVRRSMKNGAPFFTIQVLELKIGIGKPEPVPAEMFQLMKIMKSLEILTAPLKSRYNFEIRGYFVPWFYGVLQKTIPSFTTIDRSIAGDFLQTYLEYIKQYPSYKIGVVSDAATFQTTFGLNTDIITATLNQSSAAWFQQQGAIMDKLTRKGLTLGSLSQNNLEAARNAARAVLQNLPKNNRNYEKISGFLAATRGVVRPNARPGISSRLAYLRHPNIKWFDPRRAALVARAGLKATRRLARHGINTSYPLVKKVNAGNSPTNISENEPNILEQAAEGRNFQVNATPTQINARISAANTIKQLSGVEAILKATNRIKIKETNRNLLKQKIALKKATIAANLARKNPGNSAFQSQANLYARLAGVALPPVAAQAMEVNNLEAQMRALQQAGRR
jgi:hypothetical protein